MKESYNFSGIEFTMSAKCNGVVNNVWDDNRNHYKFTVVITSATGRTQFSFYDSVANYEKGVTELDRDGMRAALCCFLSDGMAYDYAYNFADFCNELGFDHDSRKALRIYNACGRSHSAAVRVFGENYADIYNGINA